MNRDLILNALGESCAIFRKGEPVKSERKGGLLITTIDGFPALAEAYRFKCDLFIDCHFVTIGIDMAKAEEWRHAVLAELEQYRADLTGGPSYMTIGAMIGDQTAAFCLMAFGEALGWWRVITPEKLHMKGSEADYAAGVGYVFISGFTKEVDDDDRNRKQRRP